jgi:hypothetical protein
MMIRPKQLGYMLLLAGCAWGIARVYSLSPIHSANAEPYTGGSQRSDPFASQASSAPSLGIRRQWSDVKGRKLVAKFVELDGDKVVLDRDGKPARVDFDKLSAADQLYVLKVVKDRGQAPGLPQARSTDPPSDDTTDQAAATPRNSGSAKKAPNERIARSQPSGSSSGNPKPWISRTWTDTAGNKKTARLKTLDGTTVVLIFRNKPLEVPFNLLSAEDQAYIRERLVERGQQDLLAAIDGRPTAPPNAFAAAPPAPPNRFAEMQREHEERAKAAAAGGNPFGEAPQPPGDHLAQNPPARFGQSNPAPVEISPPPNARSTPIPTPQPPQVQTTRVFQCNKCGRSMDSVPKDHKCPGCGITFGYIQNEDGTKTDTGAGGGIGRIRISRGFVKVVGWGIVVVVGAIVAFFKQIFGD